MMELEGLVAGRIVHYVPHETETIREIRPAIIVQVWDQSSGCCNLQVFTDGSNDSQPTGLYWATSRLFAEPQDGEKAPPGTWHWIPRA